jgi:hypothetical protein
MPSFCELKRGQWCVVKRSGGMQGKREGWATYKGGSRCNGSLCDDLRSRTSRHSGLGSLSTRGRLHLLAFDFLHNLRCLRTLHRLLRDHGLVKDNISGCLSIQRGEQMNLRGRNEPLRTVQILPCMLDVSKWVTSCSSVYMKFGEESRTHSST